MAESAAMSILWSEINSGQATRRSLAVAYAMVIAGYSMRSDPDLEAAHLCMMRAINADLKGLDNIKQAAWKIYEAAVERSKAC